MKSKELVLFLILNLLVSLGMYRDALWGKSLLAPLDLGPAVFENYRFMDPEADAVPQNHYIIDQFTYDLPLQHAIYQAYRSGEIPWWDPYTYGGRPLLADAHINGTDPIRLVCYALLPFEWAYNWNYVLRGLLTGLGMFLLLRHFGVDAFVAGVLAVTYQFGGWFTLYFGHPWIQGSFVYYPFLWLIWLKAVNQRLGSLDAVGAVLCGLIFWAGNLQSHTYLPVFAACFLLALLFKDRARFGRGVALVAVSGLTGALLASPVLANQVEFFLLSTRAIDTDTTGVGRLMAVPLSCFSLYPWAMGTFKTLDVGKLFGSGGVAFGLFCGCAASILAVAGGWSGRRAKGTHGLVVLQAILMIGIYLLIVATPLSKLLYPRIAGMAGMAVILLAGLGWRDWAAGKVLVGRRFVLAFITLLAVGAVGSSMLVVLLFPGFQPAIEQKVLAAGESSGLFTLALRKAQVARLPEEATLLNPEAVIGLTAALLMAAALGAAGAKNRIRWGTPALLLGLAATFSFHHRFRPKHDIALWERMKAGGELQQEAMRLLKPGFRLDETAVGVTRQIFPLALPALYQIHTIHGYSALQPRSLNHVPPSSVVVNPDWRADYTYSPDKHFNENTGGKPCRFRTLPDGGALPAVIDAETHNQLILSLHCPVTSTQLLRTDTFYPGWALAASPAVKGIQYGYCFSTWPIPESFGLPLAYRYRPDTASAWPWSLGMGASTVAVLVARARRSQRRPAANPR